MNKQRNLLALFLALVAIVLVVACNKSNLGHSSRQGGVRVKLSAAPSTGTATASRPLAASMPMGSTGTSASMGDDGGDGTGGVLSQLQHLNVTFSDMLARNVDGDLIELTITLPDTVDLLTLMNGQQITLPMGTLPAGMYDQLVVVINNVELVFLDGGKITLTPPGGGWTKIIPVTPFEVVDGQTITIDLQFKPGQALQNLGGDFQFFPDFACDGEEHD
jgi:hypothetical protein